jgi:FAD/FMN-containing dehydrogenase
MGPERALGHGSAADVFVARVPWRRLVRTYDEVRGALLGDAERVGCRLQAPRPSHATLAFPFVVRAPDDRDARDLYLSAWRSATGAASAAGAAPEGGVGLRSLEWVRQLTEPASGAIARSVKEALDPGGIMNPGKVIPSPQEDGS